MELDELKKSWNVLDEHLKDKKLINDEDISRLIKHATENISQMSLFNQRLRIISYIVIGLVALVFILNRTFPDIYFQIVFLALIPAIGWDIFTSRFLTHTRIDEMPLVTAISRFNRIHRWMIRERIIGIGFMLFMAGFFFIHRRIWEDGTGMMIFFFALWAVCCSFPLWVYHKHLDRLREIKKNLDELKELKK